MLLSRLLGKQVLAKSGDSLGKLRDLVARLEDDALPVVSGLVVSMPRVRDVFVPIAEVDHLTEERVALRTAKVDVRPFERREGEVLLSRDLLDKKVIDLSRGRTARANDLMLEQRGGLFRVTAVDVSLGGLAARLGLGHWFQARRHVPWEQIDVLATQIPIGQPGLRHSKLAKLHPSDLAQIVDDLAAPQAEEIVNSLDEAIAADAVEDLHPRIQATVLGSMDEERAADILEEMGDDAAADVLGDMEPGRAEKILAHMNQDDAEAIRALMPYGDDTAGGRMTTEFVAFPSGTTAGDALAQLRAAEWVPDLLPAVYIVDHEGRLLGEAGLRNVVLASPETPLDALAASNPVSAQPDLPEDEAARLVARYNLLALPIVDENGILLGIITADDALDVLVGKRRSQRFFD